MSQSLLVVSFLTSWSLAADGERLNVAPNGSFEADLKRLGGWIPVGVVPEEGEHGISITDAVARSGRRSLKIVPGPAGLVRGRFYFADYNGGEGKRVRAAKGGVRGARTFAMRLDEHTVGLKASAWVRKPSAAAATLSALWTTRRQRRPVVEVGRDAATRVQREEAGWQLLELEGARPHGALQVQIVIETDAVEPMYVDDVHLTFELSPGLTILVDQLGYESASGTKVALLQSSRELGSLSPARVIDLRTFEAIAEAPWVSRGYLPEWDRHHWTANFSSLRRAGRYVVAFGKGRRAIYSPPFSIGPDLMVRRTAEIVYRFYYYQRCGMEIPGFHAACHLDDARLPDGTHRDLTGGWHDAGDYNKYNGFTPEAVHRLVYAYHHKRSLFRRFDRDGNGLADVLDEARWGARLLGKMLDRTSLELLSSVSSGYRYWGPPESETDNRPDSGDERPVTRGKGDLSHCVAAFALLGKYAGEATDPVIAGESGTWTELAKRIYERIGGGIGSLVPLYVATEEMPYREAARARVKALLGEQTDKGIEGFRELAEYALAFPDDPLADDIRHLALRRPPELLALCDDRFGVARVRDAAGGLAYCRQYADVNDWYVGETSSRLDVAIDGLLAAKLGVEAGRTVAENQVHWILGRNPMGVSMMEGVGARFVPQYHHRYNAIPGNPRGAVPGALINGMIRAWPGVDRPWLDMSAEPNSDYHSNEPWLLHNNRWLHLIALW